MQKDKLRIYYKKKREKLTAEEIDHQSLAIANQLLQLDIWGFSFYHIFLSILKLKEINTEYILHILNGKDKNILVSKSDFSNQTMKHFLLTDSTPLKVNDWGIPEPVNGIEINSQQIEVVFLPLLAFDKNGNRIGYGKGFYDKFLAECSAETLKIGLSFFEAEEELIETYSSDVPLDICVTPENIYRF